ncbi:hypothetical protein [Streptomyces sp. WMMB 322]|uniref:hypothetical protein n=1 Tax=Streptomyces sp. WMMB 322 TaxID=1286821 RepID=UPI0006E1D772|nr:hypothetical protein [Streptomyces sp. WMMB 322]SCK06585.1 hypothetical protein H180DRAFT_00190 [Streptomyces sp. WMMB 322]
MLDIGYSLSRRFPDPPQTDYRTADVRALRHDLFSGDVYLADTEADRELSTAWGWLPVLDFAWALCDTVELLDAGPPPASGRGGVSPGGTSPGFAGEVPPRRSQGEKPGEVPPGSRAAGPRYAEVDFTESTDRMRFERRFGWVDITADWSARGEPPLTFQHTELRREARDFLHDLLADLTDMHEGLADNPVVWTLRARFPRV